MEFFVIQVRSRKEEQFIEIGKELIDKEEGQLICPRKRLTIRKQGKKNETKKPIFPGYIFFEAQEVSSQTYARIRKIPGFLRFLENREHIRPLSTDDKKLLLHFLSFGEIMEKSKVFFGEDSRIQVKSGPLKGLEGQIVKVDKRKGRAKVRLNMYKNCFLVDFGFELLSPPESQT